MIEQTAPFLSIRDSSEYMKADAFGFISRPSIKMTASGQWRMTGAVRFDNFGRIAERFSLADIAAGKIAWQHDNGKQRVHVADFDHGSYRVWGGLNHAVTPVGKFHAVLPLPNTIYCPLTDYMGREYVGAFVQRSPANGPGWYVFAVASNVSARVVKIIARPDVPLRSHPHYNGKVQRGWLIKREALAVAEHINASMRGEK